MIYSHRWAQGSSLVRAVLLALVLTALVSILLLFASPRSASALTAPAADYRFQNTRSTSVGTAPALTDIGPGTNTFTTAAVDGASRKVLHFPKGNGLRLSSASSVVGNSGVYTIVVLFEFDNVDGFRRIIDFKNGTSDNGLYVHDGKLEFYPRASGTGAPISANTYVQVVLSRDSSGQVRGYVDGVPQFSFPDSSSEAVIDSSDTLRFFRDNVSGGVNTEHSAGSVVRLRLYNNTALFDPDVVVVDRIEPTVFTVNSAPDAQDLDGRDGKCDVSATAGIQCTLRAAIQQANVTAGEDTINFASGLPGTIPLAQGQLSIGNDPSTANDLNIKGPGARALTVSGNNASRVFEIGSGANATINGLTISGGNTRGFGGGIYNNGGTLTITNSTVSGNSANAGFGGGLYNGGGTLTLTRTTVSGNQAIGEFAGGIRNGGVGGGIANNSGTLTLTNSTVSGNSATDNTGGINNLVAGSTMTLTNTTVTNNSPGGISNSGTASLANTIVAGNSPSTFPDVQGTFTSQGNNLIGQNPLLGPLANNGGPTNTHALLAGSPAIDTGANFNCPSPDQRGAARPQDGNGDGTVICDIGAFEAANTSPTITNPNPASGSKTRDRTPLIAATVRDEQTNLAKANISLFVDGKRKSTFSYDDSKDRLSYTSGQLSLGRHTVKIVATDGVLSTTRSYSFKVVRG